MGDAYDNFSMSAAQNHQQQYLFSYCKYNLQQQNFIATSLR